MPNNQVSTSLVVRTTGGGAGRRIARSSVFKEEKPMTFEECQQALVKIRRKQGTRYPLLRVDYGGTIFRGRLSRADSDPEYRQDPVSPFGVLVLEQLGLGRGPQTILQIANIPATGLQTIDEQ
jgi:hypothetical protein